MGVNGEALWEVQWHPAGGGRFRRLVLTRRGLRRSLLALGLLVVVVLVIVGALPLGLQGFFTRFTVEAARRENAALKAQGDSLGEQSVMVAGRLFHQIQRARRLAWAMGAAGRSWGAACPAPPPAGASDEATVRWLTDQAAHLQAIGDDLQATGEAGLRCPLAAMPMGAPIDRLRAVPVSLFGWRPSPFTGKTIAQYGTTLAAPEGEPVLATGAGRVLFAGAVRERQPNEWTRLGNVVVVDHGGDVVTIFGHLRDVSVRRGQAVARGDRIGGVGQTGWTRVPAVYYELRWPVGSTSRPIDPGMVTLAIPVEDLDARLADPSAGLPPGYATLDRLLGGATTRAPARRPVRHNPLHLIPPATATPRPAS